MPAIALNMSIRGQLLSGIRFNPSSLFSSSEPGVWFDPSDLTTLFQDVAGTVPVTTPGQSVARINDKSGRNNHATQNTAAARPTYQVDSSGRGFLLFDGVDDSLVTPAIAPNTNKLQVFAGLRKLSDSSPGIFAELGIGIPNGGFYLAAPNSVGPTYGFASRGTTQVTFTTLNNYPTPITSVLAGQASITPSTVNLRHNGVDLGTVISSQGTGNYSTLPLNIGRRGNGTVPFSGRLYGLIVRFGSVLTSDLVSSTENWINSKTGAY